MSTKKAGKAPKREKLSEADAQARRDALKAESKSDKFSRLARKRVTKAVRAIKALEPLGRGQYTSTPEQVNKLLQYLVDAVADVKIAFAPKARASAAAQELLEL